MKLYQQPYSHYSAKVRIILLEKSIDHQLPPIPGEGQSDPLYRAINPTGLVPCLVDEELVLGESEVIAEYLNERVVEPAMLPGNASQNAQSRWLSRTHDLYLAPVLSQMFGHTLADKPDASAIDASIESLNSTLASIEQRVSPSPYFFGDRFCISDASLCLSFWYAIGLSEQLGAPIRDENFPKLFAWFEAVSKRESVTKVIHDCKVALGIDDESAVA